MNKSLEPLIVILAIIINVVVIYNVSRHLLDQEGLRLDMHSLSALNKLGQI